MASRVAASAVFAGALLLRPGTAWGAIEWLAPAVAATEAGPPEEPAPGIKAAASRSADETLIRRLLDQWAAQSGDIATAHIHFRSYIGRCRRPDLTAADVDELLARYDLVAQPEAFLALLAELLQGTGRSLADLPDPVWFVREYHQLGDRRRLIGSNGTIHILDADHELIRDAGDTFTQTTVSPRGASSLLPPGMHLFLRDPSRGLPAARWRVRSRGDPLVLEIIPADPEVSQPADWIEVDPPTGLMLRDVGHHRGHVYREHRQQGLAEYEGGIVLPAVSLTLDYRDGVLRQIFYRAIESAVLNGPVDEDLFRMPIDAGTVVVDNRAAETRVVRAATSAADVVSFLAAVSDAPEGPPPSRTSFWRWLLAVNGIVLLAASAVLWRRARRASGFNFDSAKSSTS